MTGLYRHFLLIFFLCAPFQTGAAQVPDAPHKVNARLEAEILQPNPGEAVTLAFVMTPMPGWHDYWLNPADAGGPLTVEWQLPAGVTAGPLQFPVPEPLVTSGFMNHVYDREHAILSNLQIDSGVAAGTVLPIRAKASWFACSDSLCLRQTADLNVQLTSGKGTAAPAPRFDRWRAELPAALDRPARFARSGKILRIAVPLPAPAEIGPVHFFAATKDVLEYAAPQKARRQGDWLVIETRAGAEHKGPIEGVLRIGDRRGLWVRAIPGTVPGGGETIAVVDTKGQAGAADSVSGFSLLLLGALIGGLLLNIMPCVFPILGLKALALAKAGGDEIAARRDALAYSAGVIASCLLLGAMMLALRAAGEEIGWAFQLQQPVFVLFLLLLMVAVTANLAGLFELRSTAFGSKWTATSGTAGSFATGILAALVATPCTGPFMAAAMGAALLLPVTQALALFGVLGLGLALPFLAIAFVPAVRRRLPKPGPWLGRFRIVMAIPMGLTAFALLWLLWRLSGSGGLWIGVAASLVILALLVLRKRTSPVSLLPAAALLALLVASGGWILPQHSSGQGRTANRLIKTVPFSEARLAELRKRQQPVFLYFTADWCITCKVNEATAIQTPETAKAFKAASVVMMEADFTRNDPVIAGFLVRHGRSGVPLYLYYPPGKDGTILPQILTREMLVALEKN